LAGILQCFILSGQVQSDYVPLKELFKKDFLIGVAVNSRAITGDAGKFVVENFNTMTCENEMKLRVFCIFQAGRSSQGQGGQPGQAARPPQAQVVSQAGSPGSGRTTTPGHGWIPAGAS